MRGDWRKLLKMLRESGSAASDPYETQSYGMHVSVNRAALSVKNQVKFVSFMNNNQKLSETVAQRTANEYAQYGLKDPGEINYFMQRGRRSDKYQATRIDNGRIEVRIFKSVLEDWKFLKNIEYVHSAIGFAKDKEQSDLSDGNYIDWLDAKKRKYPHLHRFITGEKYVPSNIQARESEAQPQGDGESISYQLRRRGIRIFRPDIQESSDPQGVLGV
jgi:hypothetical protein